MDVATNQTSGRGMVHGFDLARGLIRRVAVTFSLAKSLGLLRPRWPDVTFQGAAMDRGLGRALFK